MPTHLLAIDQGTTSTRAIVFDGELVPVASAQREFRQIYPRPGWVEHDPEDIWASTVATVSEALARAKLRAADVAALGLANQRETVVVWERATGAPIHNAVVWQDRRTDAVCASLKAEGLESEITRRTGLLLDPYFSATKLGWILDHVDGARAKAEAGELLFGTIDAFLIWRMTVGQACFAPGMAKITYGTGAFALLHTGDAPVASRNKLLTTVALQLGGRRTFALEGAIFVAGAAVQWLRDGLKLVREAAETDALARAADPGQDVYLVPAFVGLGAPHWDAGARAALIGLTRGTGAAEIARATLESVGYQTRDLIEAMRADWPDADDVVLRVDGGMAASDWTLQFVADALDAPVDRPAISETTALGAAYLAGLAAGLCPEPDEFSKSWRLDRRFEPAMDAATRERKLAGWADAVERVKTR
jgi:glycerol kinase